MNINKNPEPESFKKLLKPIFGKITRKHLYKFLKGNATEDEILEIGARNCRYSELFPNALSLDIEYHKEVDIVGDVHKLPFKNDSQSIILCTEVLEHCYSPQDAINEMFRVLKPGGRLILTTRFLFPIHFAPHDYFRFTKYGLRYLCREFSHVEIMEEATTMVTMAILFQRLALQTQCLFKIPLINALFMFSAKIYEKLQWLIIKEYSDFKTTEEKTMMSSGYYVIAIK